MLTCGKNGHTPETPGIIRRSGFNYGYSMDFGSNEQIKRASYPCRAATTSYRCYLPVLTGFRGSWPHGTCPQAIVNLTRRLRFRHILKIKRNAIPVITLQQPHGVHVDRHPAT